MTAVPLYKFADCVFVLISSVLLNLLCVWILFQNSHSCFRFSSEIDVTKTEDLATEQFVSVSNGQPSTRLKRYVAPR